MTINIVFRSFTEITECTGAGTSVPRYVSPDHCTVVYRYTSYTAHPYSVMSSSHHVIGGDFNLSEKEEKEFSDYVYNTFTLHQVALVAKLLAFK